MAFRVEPATEVLCGGGERTAGPTFLGALPAAILGDTVAA
jgi:hypothetical protein